MGVNSGVPIVTYKSVFYNLLGQNPEVWVQFSYSPLYEGDGVMVTHVALSNIGYLQH